MDASGETLLPMGIVTARDIVTRVVAAELDPAVLTVGDIAWTTSPGQRPPGSHGIHNEGATP